MGEKFILTNLYEDSSGICEEKSEHCGVDHAWAISALCGQCFRTWVRYFLLSFL